MTVTADDIVASARSLAALPSTYVRLTEVLAAPDATAESVAAVVKLDPGLSARLLKLANSVAYSPPKPVHSLAHATSMVGMNTIRNLALATGVVMVFRGVPEHLLSMGSFWKHSVAVASAAHLLAIRARTVTADVAFVAGLLHDVGELLICLQRPLEAREVIIRAENTGAPNFEVERELFGFTHAEVGARLLEVWGLGAAEVAAARFHHDPTAAPAAHRRVTELVHVADVTVSALQIGNAGERAAHPLSPAAWSRSGLRANDMDSAIQQLDRQMGSLAEAIAD